MARQKLGHHDQIIFTDCDNPKHQDKSGHTTGKSMSICSSPSHRSCDTWPEDNDVAPLLKRVEKFYCRVTLQAVYPSVVHRLLYEYDKCCRFSLPDLALLTTLKAILRGMCHHYDRAGGEALMKDDPARLQWDDVPSTFTKCARKINEFPEFPGSRKCTWEMSMYRARLDGTGIEEKNEFHVIIPLRSEVEVRNDLAREEVPFLAVVTTTPLQSPQNTIDPATPSPYSPIVLTTITNWTYFFNGESWCIWYSVCYDIPKMETTHIVTIDVLFMEDIRLSGCPVHTLLKSR